MKSIFMFFLTLACSSAFCANASEAKPQVGAPIAEYLDTDGRLKTPSDYLGNLDPTGFQMVSKAGEAPRFLPVNDLVRKFGAVSSQWTIFGYPEVTASSCNSIRAVARMENGDLVVGGRFNACHGVPAINIAIYSPSSGTWSGLPGSGNIGNAALVGEISAIAVAGKDIYVGGAIGRAGSAPISRLARWNGSAWSGLGSSVNGDVHALATSGSDLYVGGTFTQAGATLVSNLARWNGSDWSTVGSSAIGSIGVDAPVTAMVALGGDLFVGGKFRNAGGISANRVAKWNGSTWSSIGVGISNGVENEVTALALLGSNFYVASNAVGLAGGASIARWNGSEWSGLGSGNALNGLVRSFAVVGNDLYASGNFSQAGGAIASGVARWNGTNWFSLGAGVTNGANNSSVAGLMNVGNDLYVVGNFSHAGGVSAKNVARWRASNWSGVGSFSTNNKGVNGNIRHLTAVDQDVYAVGDFSIAGGVPAKMVARWNGSVWFGLNADIGQSPFNALSINAVAVSGNDVYIAGRFNSVGGTPANNIARWNGNAWTSLGSGISFSNSPNSGSVFALTVAPGGLLYVGGSFNSAGGVPAINVASWDGTEWFSLGIGNNNGVSGEVNALAVVGTDTGNDLYVGGSFNQVGGQIFADNIARWSSGSWSPLGDQNRGLNNTVTAIAVSGRDLYVGGHFTQTAIGSPAKKIARLSAGTWTNLGVGLDPNDSLNIKTLVVFGPDLYLGGDYFDSSIGRRAMVARWNGAVWSNLSPGLAPLVSGEATTVSSLATSEGGVFVGGNFGLAGGEISVNIAKLNASTDTFSDGFERD